MYDGMDLAIVVYEAGLTTRVLAGNMCASSCFTVYAAGAKREYEKGARIGVHSAIHDLEGETHSTKGYTVDLMRFLAGFIKFFAERKADSLEWDFW